jgi:hypothetical protein
MKRLMISAIAVGVLMVVATTMLWSRSSSIELSAAAMPPLQELQDQSLVYPTAEKR